MTLRDDDGEPLLDSAAAALALGVSVATLWRWARRHPGYLPRRRRGPRGGWLYRLEDVRRAACQRAD